MHMTSGLIYWSVFEEIVKLNINKSKKQSCCTRSSQYVVVVAREWLSLIAVIYFHTSMFLNQVSALCTDVELVKYIQHLAYLGETTLLNYTPARVKHTQ